MLANLILLLGGHWLCDIALQSGFIAKGKNHKTAISGIPWWQVMAAHAGIHMLMVFLITQSTWMSLAELVIHFTTDWAKCDDRFGSGERAYNIDQTIHIACKIMWALLMIGATNAK